MYFLVKIQNLLVCENIYIYDTSYEGGKLFTFSRFATPTRAMEAGVGRIITTKTRSIARKLRGKNVAPCACPTAGIELVIQTNFLLKWK